MSPGLAAAGFNYVAPSAPRAAFAAVDDPSTLASTLARLAPRGMTLRYDRRVDPSRRIGRSYGGWRALLWGEGLAGDVNGTEIHVRPAGVAPGAAELVSGAAGRRDWAVRAGETLTVTLGRWAGAAGLEIAVLTDRSWRLGISHVFRSRTFDEACAALLLGLSHMPHPPAAERVGNVVTVTHRLAPDAAPGRVPGRAPDPNAGPEGGER
ncbi:MAG: hypothetical protein OYH76_19160 [Defluviicoccus sp.]|nr:hypothetical protein [Defluviicoccus sp.]MDE0278020.1 hypothetical protein [Defluviicoccus sp.]